MHDRCGDRPRGWVRRRCRRPRRRDAVGRHAGGGEGERLYGRHARVSPRRRGRRCTGRSIGMPSGLRPDFYARTRAGGGSVRYRGQHGPRSRDRVSCNARSTRSIAGVATIPTGRSTGRSARGDAGRARFAFLAHRKPGGEAVLVKAIEALQGERYLALAETATGRRGVPVRVAGEPGGLRESVMTDQTELPPRDVWTSRARPTFLYVMYALLLWSIPMGSWSRQGRSRDRGDSDHPRDARLSERHTATALRALRHRLSGPNRSSELGKGEGRGTVAPSA